MNPQEYGYSGQQQPQYVHSSLNYVPNTPAIPPNFYPGYTTSSSSTGVPNASPMSFGQSIARPVSQLPQMPPAVQPPSLTQLVTEIPANLFFNIAATSPGLADVFPTPSGTRHKSLLEDPQTKEKAEAVLCNPTTRVVNSVAELLSATQVHNITFKKVQKKDRHASQPSIPPIPQPSALELCVRQANPVAFNVGPTPHSVSSAVQSGSGFNPRSQQQLPAQYSTARAQSPEISGLPSVANTHVIPHQLSQQTKAPTSRLSNQPIIPAKASKPPKSLSSDSEYPPSPMIEPPRPIPKLKIVFPSKNAKPAQPVADENARIRGPNQSGSPEYPEISPSASRSQPFSTQLGNTPVNQINTVEGKRDSLAVDNIIFDPAKLTLKISTVDVTGCMSVFCDAMEFSSRKTKKSNTKERILESRKSTFSPESFGEHPSLHSFMTTSDRVLRHISRSDISHLVMGDPNSEFTDADIPSEAILSQSLVAQLASDAAKLKAHAQAHHVPFDSLKETLIALLPTILQGYIIPSDLIGYSQDSEESDASVYREILNSRVIRGAEAVTAALNIMTSSKLPKEIYNTDVMEACIRFAKYQVTHSLYPAFDPLYRYEANSKDGFVAKIKQKRARYGSTKDEAMLKLYSRFEDIAVLFADVVSAKALEEPAMYQLASLGVSAFFVENIQDYQLKSLRLVASIFAKYEKHRDIICDDILSSLARLPSSKRNLRSYAISDSGDRVQMISALILHLIQSIARLPTKRQFAKTGDVDYEMVILSSYDQSVRCAKHILSAFFTKCATKGEEDYRPLFENFIVDLLSMMSRPEWPAAECLLSLLANILLQKFNDRTLDANFRYTSIDSLGLIASRMRRDHLSVRESPQQLQEVVTKLYQAFVVGEDGMLEVDTSDEPNETLLFQQGLLQFLHRKVSSPNYATIYYLVQWYHDAVNGEIDVEAERANIFGNFRERTKAVVLDFMKKFAENSWTSDFLGKEVVDSVMANFIARHFASKRSFALSFDSYFRRIITMATDSTMQIRIRAIKCVSQIIDSDGSLMSREEVKSLVESRMWDNSAMIRETVIEMIGKYAVIDSVHMEQYKMVLLKRLFDTAPSVRKKAIKVLHDFCVQHPDHALCAEICCNIIKRINDEETIKKLVYEVFLSTWFQPSAMKDPTVSAKRVEQIIDVIDLLDQEAVSATDWFQKLLKDFLKRDAEENTKIRKTCKVIVDHIMNRILAINAEVGTEESSALSPVLRTARCFLALNLFVKCCPELGMPHAGSLPPFLNQTLTTKSDQKIIVFAAEILTLVIPLVKSPPDFLLAQIEESCVALYTKPGVTIQLLQVNTECLAAVVNNATHNYKIVRDLYESCYRILADGTKTESKTPVSSLQRAMCLVALIVQYFDVDHESFGYVHCTTEKLVTIFFSLLRHKVPAVQARALQGLGFVFIRRPETMLSKNVVTIYGNILKPENKNVDDKKIVLGNLLKFLQHEESQIVTMEESASASEHYAQLDLRGNQTASAELPRKIIYGYLKNILECGFDQDPGIRNEVLSLIAIIIQLRFSHPQQALPFLISMASDTSELISGKANSLLEEVHRKYHGTLSTKAVNGIQESYGFQKMLSNSAKSVIRGFRTTPSGAVSVIGNVYGLLRNDRQQRRNLISKLLELFKYEDSPLDQLQYFVDNIAYFPYQALDEPLFVIHQIEPILAIISPDALQRFQKAFQINPSGEGEEGEDDDWETPENFRKSCPTDLTDIRLAYRSCQPSILLIALKRYLMAYYGITQAKMKEYSPSEPMKTFEKPIVSRKTNCKFEPTSTVEYLTKDLKGDLNDYLSAPLLIKKYFDFKTVVEIIDDREVPGDSDANRGADDFEDFEMDDVEGIEMGIADEECTSGTNVDSNSAPSTPTKKRKADDAFKKPKTPRKKRDSSAPKRPRGRPRKNATPLKDESRCSSEEEDESWSY